MNREQHQRTHGLKLTGCESCIGQTLQGAVDRNPKCTIETTYTETFAPPAKSRSRPQEIGTFLVLAQNVIPILSLCETVT